MKVKGIISLIGLIASLLTIYIFISGNFSINDINIANSEKQQISDNSIQSMSQKTMPYIELEENGEYTKIIYVSDKAKNVILDAINLWSEKDVLLSPNAEHIFVYDGNNKIHFIDSNGGNHQTMQTNSNSLHNFIWITDKKLRFSVPYPYTDIESFKISESGTYELLLDDYNTLIEVKKYEP